MSDGTKTRQNVTDAIAYIGFIFLIPIGLSAFGFNALMDLLKPLGFFGSAVFLILVVYFLLLLKIFFGGDQKILPIFLSFLTSFLLFATFARIGFMSWYTGLTDQVFFLANPPLNFFMGILALVLGIVLSYLRKNIVILEIFLIIVVPVGLLVANGYLHLIPVWGR